MISIIPLYNDSFQGGFDLCKLGQFHASTALLGDGCPRRRDGPTSCQGCLKLNALHYGRGWNRARFPATIPAFALKLLPNMWTHWSDIFCHVLSPMKLEVIKNIIPVCWRAWYMVYPLAQTNIVGWWRTGCQTSIHWFIHFVRHWTSFVGDDSVLKDPIYNGLWRMHIHGSYMMVLVHYDIIVHHHIFITSH